MYITMIKPLAVKTLLLYVAIILVSIIICAFNQAQADTRFVSKYSCSDTGKYCISSGTRTIDGYEVTRGCWEWGYIKKCNVPSLNDCAQHSRCYSLGRRDCLLKDNYGSCINWKKEFSCKRWIPTYVESSHVRYGTEDKDGQEGLVCEGVPCIDGNCVDKSYQMDAEMMNSVSKLYAISQGQSDGYNFKIFEGAGRHCSKKPTGYSNCCRVEKPGDGWGKEIGAKCTKDEDYLMEQRSKNLCVYVGKKSKKTAGITTVIKHHFCCFSSILEKIVQVQGRAQLGLNFGSGGNSDCRGLTLEELERINFSLIDFTEFAVEVQKRMVVPSGGDVEERILGSLSKINGFDEERPASLDNKLAGVNQSLIGPTPEEIRLEEERLAKLEAERLEQERIAKLEAERLEAIRLAEIEAERVKKIRIARMVKVEAEVATKQRKYDRDFAHWTALGVEYQRLWNEYLAFQKQYTNAQKPASYYQYLNTCDEYNSLRPQIQKQEQELRRLKEELARLK